MRNGKRRLSERWRGSCTCKRGIAGWLLHNFCGAWLLRHILTAENWKNKRMQGLPCHSWSSTRRIVETHHSAG